MKRKQDDGAAAGEVANEEAVGRVVAEERQAVVEVGEARYLEAREESGVARKRAGRAKNRPQRRARRARKVGRGVDSFRDLRSIVPYIVY